MKFHATPLTITITQLLTTIVSIWYLVVTPITWPMIFTILLGYFLLSCVGNSVFYHRYYSHKSFKTNKVFEYIGMTCGVLAGRGSPIDWAGMHRFHHKHADTDKDPHNPRLETWRLFFPVFLKYDNRISPMIVKDMLKVPLHRFILNYYNLLILGFVVIFGFIDFNLLIELWVIPVAITNWILGLTVFMVHTYGYQNFKTTDQSRNLWWISLIMWGEGWHNNHHTDPVNSNFKIKWWEYDIGYWIVRLIKV